MDLEILFKLVWTSIRVCREMARKMKEMVRKMEMAVKMKEMAVKK